MLRPTRFLALAALTATPLHAQAVRTWVASNGDDNAACTRTAPCRTFEGALAKTTDGGVINCVDAASYGGGVVTITISVTIDCTGTGGTQLSPVNAISIDPPDNSPNFSVILRGLEIDGVGVNAGSNGVRFFGGGGSLTIENSLIRNFTANGISFEPTLAARLHVINTTITNTGNPTSGVGAGIAVTPSGAGYANVTLDDARMIGNGGIGLVVQAAASNSASSNVLATRSSFIASRDGITAIGPAGAAGASIVVRDSIVNGNSVSGLRSNGPVASIVLSNTTISGNSTGITTLSGGIAGSYGNNQLIRNGVNGAFNGFVTGN